VEGQEQYAEGWIKCFHALVGGEAVYDPRQWVSD
jgi:hypothetical protein